jgi:hypothetical protein
MLVASMPGNQVLPACIGGRWPPVEQSAGRAQARGGLAAAAAFLQRAEVKWFP